MACEYNRKLSDIPCPLDVGTGHLKTMTTVSELRNLSTSPKDPTVKLCKPTVSPLIGVSPRFAVSQDLVFRGVEVAEVESKSGEKLLAIKMPPVCDGSSFKFNMYGYSDSCVRPASSSICSTLSGRQPFDIYPDICEYPKDLLSPTPACPVSDNNGELRLKITDIFDTVSYTHLTLPTKRIV